MNSFLISKMLSKILNDYCINSNKKGIFINDYPDNVSFKTFYSYWYMINYLTIILNKYNKPYTYKQLINNTIYISTPQSYISKGIILYNLTDKQLEELNKQLNK